MTPSGWFDRRRVTVCLTLIVLFGVGVRVWYALPEPTSKRFWDERYALENVTGIVEAWGVEPVRGYYPAPLQSWPQALAVAGGQWLSEALDAPILSTVARPGVYTPTGYILIRLLSVVYGAAAIVVIFLIGRRLFSPGVGMLAGLALASMPWHIHVSGKFKPDALLVLTVLLAFYWSLLAIERARARDYALAGFGICLALSAKIMGGLVALPLVVGSLMMGWRDRRRLGLVVVAAATSLISFMVLNPHGLRYLYFAASLQRDYAKRAELAGMTRASMPRELISFLIGDGVHGAVVGVLALVGMVALAVSLVGPKLTRLTRSQRAMLVVFPPLYAAAYMVATPYFKGNNLLPIAPFTLLAAFWLLAVSVGWSSRRWPLLASPAPRFAALAGLVLLVVAPGPVYVFRSVTPTTLDAAERFIGRAGRLVVAEEVAVAAPEWEMSVRAQRQFALVEVERLAASGAERVDRADGELFARRRLDGEDSEFYLRRIQRVEADQIRTFVAAPFRLRGPPVVALRHPHRRLDAALPLAVRRCRSSGGCFAADLPSTLLDGELVSIVAHIRRRVVARMGPPTLWLGETALPLYRSRRHQGVRLWVSERVELGAERRVRVEGAGKPLRQDRIGIFLERWQGPGE